MTASYLPFDTPTWRRTMGLRPLEPSRWFEFDEESDAQLALKDELLATRRDDVLRTSAAAEEACVELLDEIRRNLALYHPSRAVHVDAGEDPLVAAARLVPEDLCVLVRGESWRLAAGCVCFPLWWTIGEKVGLDLDAIHGPVPDYGAMASPVRGLFDRLAPGRSYWRLNWSVLDEPTLFLPNPPTTPREGDEWYVRVERQTLRALARTGAVVFTIHSYVRSVRELARSEPEAARHLLGAIESAPPEIRRYKRLDDAIGPIARLVSSAGPGR